MRNKELGLTEPDQGNSEHDSSSDPLQEDPALPEHCSEIEAEHLQPDLVLTSEQFEAIWSELEEG
jgi:hypothetical protein